ncbi:MAG: ATP-binding cassette domain-containing protein [Aeromicrobium sp.]
MLETRELTRSYGDTVVVDHVDLQVRPGRITGFVGANGAGKTTTMRMMMGVLAPTSGTVLWNGEPVDAADRRRFGYMPEERGLYPRMKVLEQLIFFARLHGISTADARERATKLLHHFGLSERTDDLLDTLSLGNQQRVQIAASLVHRPTALVLDEPFSGLDPLAVDSMVDLLRDEASGLPLLFSSHQLELVERLCDDIVILAEGRVVAAGPVDELSRRGAERYRVELDGEDAAWLRDVRGVHVVDVDGSVALLDLDGLDAADLARTVVSRSQVIELSRARQPLSDIFREAVR